MHHHRGTTSIALAGLIALGFGTPAWAADEGNASTGEQAPAGETSAEAVSDQQLEQFAVALNSVRKIRMEYGSKLQQADDKAQQKQLKQEGRQDMLQAIRESGLEVKEYNQIGNRIGNDAELKQRVRKIMQKQSG